MLRRTLAGSFLVLGHRILGLALVENQRSNSIIIGAMVSHTTLEWYTRTVSVLEPLVVIIHLGMP